MLLLCGLTGDLPPSHTPRRELTPGSGRCTLLSPREGRGGLRAVAAVAAAEEPGEDALAKTAAPIMLST